MARLPGKIDFAQFYDWLTEPERVRFDEACERKWVMDGAVLLREHEASDCVLIVDDGTVEVVIDSPGVQDLAPLGYLGKGDLLGEMKSENWPSGECWCGRDQRAATSQAGGMKDHFWVPE